MNVYSYIAESNPQGCFEICKKYGFFQVADVKEMSDVLQTIVGMENEDAFKDVMDLHPDKAVILELFEKKIDGPMTKQECDDLSGVMLNANGGRQRIRDRRRIFAANGQQQGSASQTNTYILVGAIIVALAIVSSIKK